MCQSAVSKKHGHFSASLATTRELVRELAHFELPFRKAGDPSIRHVGLAGVLASQYFCLTYSIYPFSWRKAFQLRVVGALACEVLSDASKVLGGVKFKKPIRGETSRNHMRVVYTSDIWCVHGGPGLDATRRCL